MMEKSIIVRRSMLIMPADREPFVEKVWKRNADAVCLDLEDGVAGSNKDRARQLVEKEIPIAGKGGSDVIVRVNSEWGMQREDLSASVHVGLKGIILTKVEDPDQLSNAEEFIAELERLRGIEEGHLDVTILIESALGYARLDDILKATKRAKSITLGTEDFVRDIGIPKNDGTGLEAARMHINIMGCAYGLEPRGLLGTISDYSDTNAIYEVARKSYEFGYRGATCIHPNQVEPYNRAFAPTQEQLNHAEAVWRVFSAAKEENKGTVSLNGKMVDIPIALRAKRLLDIAEAAKEKEKFKKAMRERNEGNDG